MALLEVRDLVVQFTIPGGRVRAVDGVSFDVDTGESVGLVGESGCGKTTTALAIMRLLPENGKIVSGTITLDGEELVALKRGPLRRKRWKEMSIIFQGAMNSLNPVQRVGDQVAEPIPLHEPSVTAKEADSRVAELFDMVGINPSRRTQYPHEFSGGMRQRVMIAMALANRPKLVIGDEPTTALDVMVQAQILELLERLRRELGLAMILITHDLSVVAETCGQAVVMYAGQLAETGTMIDLHDRPLHPYTSRLMGAVPDIGGPRDLGIGIPGQPPDLARPPAGCPFNPRCDRAMQRCVDERPSERSFGASHLVACHAVTADGLLQRPDELALIPSASANARIAAIMGSGGRIETSAPSGAPGPPASGAAAQEGAQRLLELEGVSVHFALHQGLGNTLRGQPPRLVRAVDGVDLRIGSGEVVALVGESGCGKTTTGRALVRLAPISGGRVVLDGKDVTGIGGRDLRDYRRRVQIIFQDPYDSLNPKQMISDIIAEPLDVHGVPAGPERAERVARALEDAGLRPAGTYLRRFPHELSGGQRQRVAIAAAMVLDPGFVVADEPVSMLDVSVRTGILRVMMELRQSRGVGYLFITHDLSLAWLIADRIAVMYLGRVVETGPAERLVSQPRHPYTQALLSVMPSPDPKRRSRRLILSGETPDASKIPSGCRFHPRCPLAEPFGIEDRCRIEDPPAFDVGAGVTAACWLAQPGGPLAGDIPWRGIPVVGDDGTISYGLAGTPAQPAPAD